MQEITLCLTDIEKDYCSLTSRLNSLPFQTNKRQAFATRTHLTGTIPIAQMSISRSANSDFSSICHLADLKTSIRIHGRAYGSMSHLSAVGDRGPIGRVDRQAHWLFLLSLRGAEGAGSPGSPGGLIERGVYVEGLCREVDDGGPRGPLRSPMLAASACKGTPSSYWTVSRAQLQPA